MSTSIFSAVVAGHSGHQGGSSNLFSQNFGGMGCWKRDVTWKTGRDAVDCGFLVRTLLVIVSDNSLIRSAAILSGYFPLTRCSGVLTQNQHREPVAIAPSVSPSRHARASASTWSNNAAHLAILPTVLLLLPARVFRRCITLPFGCGFIRVCAIIASWFFR